MGDLYNFPLPQETDVIDPSCMAEYGQRMSDTRRVAHYERSQRRELGWLFVLAVLGGVAIGMTIASGVQW